MRKLDLSSGVENASGMAGPVGDQDDSWTLVAALNPSLNGAAATILDPLWPTTLDPIWSTTLPGSQWVGPADGAVDGIPGSYTYESCFCLREGFAAPMLELSMRADNRITAIALNGCMLSGPPGGDFNSVTPVYNSECELRHAQARLPPKQLVPHGIFLLSESRR
ncbi:hypothetical protein [Sorangium sp. So ce887]|uniref:hypothetical protein n=1 Tax=Sorangium sp. So ce887 TaxID=3133324 RepID=UPI003F5EE133